MTNLEATDFEYHVLLIGVDAYTDLVPRQQLKGCVNDIDSIQRLLLERVGIAPTQITRLVSPHPTPVRDTTVPSKPATGANIREALANLGSEMVGPHDRVLIYYAGHGARPEIPQTDALRSNNSQRLEALVPADGDMNGANVLFDFEFNALLAGIASRTTSVAVVLDCCHSSGATRSLDGPGDNTRFIDIGLIEISADQALLLQSTATQVAAAGPGASVDSCQVIAACQSHELAHEVPRHPPPGETRSGLLTRSLVTALEPIPDEQLTSIPWGRLWNQVRANIETEPEAKGQQHPWMSGGLARAWLGGPPNDGDVGLGVERSSDEPNEYVIRGGTIAGITPGARLAIYDDRPYKFPRLGTDDDLKSRFSLVLLEVTEATPSTATAVAMGEPFDLPAGVRGRLVQPGESERLPCAVVPSDPEIVQALAASEVLEVTNDARALTRLEQQDDRTWVLTDDVHGALPGEPVLARLQPGDVVAGARDLMEHYVRYAGPIRMAKRCPDLPGALGLSLLACPSEQVSQTEIPNLRAIPREADGSYALQHSTLFCVQVHNASSKSLKVSLFYSDARGTVALLGGDRIIDGGKVEYFWWNDEIGKAFPASVPSGMDRCIDRMAVIGTTDMASDLKHLEEKGTFIVDRLTRAIGDPEPPPAPPPPPPADQWTGVEAIVRTSVQQA